MFAAHVLYFVKQLLLLKTELRRTAWTVVNCKQFQTTLKTRLFAEY